MAELSALVADETKEAATVSLAPLMEARTSFALNRMRHSGVVGYGVRGFGSAGSLEADRPAGEWQIRKVREIVELKESVLVMRASAIAGCLRRVYYAITGADRDECADPRDIAVRDLGSAMLPVVIDMLRSSDDAVDDAGRNEGWRIEDDHRVVVHALDGIEIQGHIDFVGSHPRWTRGQAVVVEIKTRSRSQKEYAAAVGVERSHRGAALQAALYAVALAGSPADNNGAAVITVSRDDLSCAVNYLPPERVLALYEECAERATNVKAAIESGEPPKPEYQAGHKICRQCEFRSVCGNADVEDDLAATLDQSDISRLVGEAVSATSDKSEKAQAKRRLKAYMIDMGLDRLEIELDGGKYSLCLSEIVRRKVNMDEFNSLVEPELRDRMLLTKTTYQFRISGGKGG